MLGFGVEVAVALCVGVIVGRKFDSWIITSYPFPPDRSQGFGGVGRIPGDGRGLGVGRGLAVAVVVGVGVGVAVAVAVGVELAVGVGVGVTSLHIPDTFIVYEGQPPFAVTSLTTSTKVCPFPMLKENGVELPGIGLCPSSASQFVQMLSGSNVPKYAAVKMKLLS